MLDLEEECWIKIVDLTKKFRINLTEHMKKLSIKLVRLQKSKCWMKLVGLRKRVHTC